MDEEYEDEIIADDGYYDEIPGEFSTLCESENNTSKANCVEKDKLNVIPNVGVVRIIPRRIRDTTKHEKQKKEGWINEGIKSIQIIQWSKKFEDKVAIDILSRNLANMNPERFPLTNSDGELEVEDSDIPFTVEDLFLQKQELSLEASKASEAGVILPPILYVSNEYNKDLLKVQPDYTDLIDKTIPFCIMKLGSDKIVPKKETPVYRLAIDAKLGYANFSNPETGETRKYIVPISCKRIIDFVNPSDYKKIKKRRKNVKRSNSSK